MIGYSTTFSVYDKDKKLIETFDKRACFHILTNNNWKKKSSYSDDLTAVVDHGHYLEYDFHNARVTEEEMRKYFLFLKSIPEFAPYMPKSCANLAKTKKYWLDMTKVNGFVAFVMLTLIRAVVEETDTVKDVIKFNRRKAYSITNLCILKAVGSVHVKNSGHWLTGKIHKKNIAKGMHQSVKWTSEVPMKKTGLINGINDHFQWEDDAWAATRDHVKIADIQALLREHKKPSNPKVKKAKQPVGTGLILDFDVSSTDIAW